MSTTDYNYDLQAKVSSSPLDLEQLHIAMAMRSFSGSGGLELYAHKLVEGLLDKGVKITVVCQNVESQFKHRNLSITEFAKPPANLSKAERVQQLFDASSAAVQHIQRSCPFSIVHSQHLPIAGAHVATFHNHTVGRLSEVGAGWERALNGFKVSFSNAYAKRDQFDRMLCETANCLVFVSKRMQEDYFKRYELTGDKAKPYVVAYPGASLPESSTTQTNPFTDGRGAEQGSLVTFLFVGKGFRKKGLDVLFDACSKLKKDGQSYQLIIAGLKKKPLDVLRLKALNIEDCVDYLGFQKDMAAVYARAQSLILPSRIEPFGMAPVQAMQFGLVPIVSAVSGVSEVLADGEDALILKDHLNSGELASHMTRLMQDRELLTRLSSKALETARRVTWEETVNQTLKAYALVVSTRRG